MRDLTCFVVRHGPSGFSETCTVEIESLIRPNSSFRTVSQQFRDCTSTLRAIPVGWLIETRWAIGGLA